MILLKLEKLRFQLLSHVDVARVNQILLYFTMNLFYTKALNLLKNFKNFYHLNNTNSKTLAKMI
jgi:hypothetical protein